MTNTAKSLQLAFGYLFVDEVPELQRLATSIRSKNPHIVNIGAGTGTSALSFLEAREDVLVTTIDKQKESHPFGCLDGELAEVTDAGYADRLNQIHSDSKKVGRGWHQDKVDMVFIDGDHSFEGCAGDILCWLRNIKEKGLISVHDYGKRELFLDGPRDDAPAPRPWPGVDGAVDLLLYPNFKFVNRVESLITFRMP